jgi:hypothetical protein
MNQALYAHMNNKRKKKKGTEIQFPKILSITTWRIYTAQRELSDLGQFKDFSQNRVKNYTHVSKNCEQKEIKLARKSSGIL